MGRTTLCLAGSLKLGGMALGNGFLPCKNQAAAAESRFDRLVCPKGSSTSSLVTFLQVKVTRGQGYRRVSNEEANAGRDRV